MRKIITLLVALTIFVVLVAACAKPAPPPTPEAKPAEPTATSPAFVAAEATSTPVVVEKITYKESPMLSDLVSRNKIPPVEKRISDDPLVTEPRESIGKYGGVIHTASWWPGVGNVLLYISEPPIKWNSDMTGYEAGLASSWEWSNDGKTFTLHLRKGVRWSDGEPYTSEDWRFWWEDMAKNDDYKVVSVPAWLRNRDGTPIDMSFPDATTVVWKSKDRSLWIDPFYMAQGFWEFANPMMKPAHYLKQSHPLYTSGKTYADLEAVDKWWQNPDFPCLFAWCSSNVADDGSRYQFVRNPFYWRVDTEGQQLPYIDYIDIELVGDEQVRILNCTQGKYDTAFRVCGGPNDIPLIEENAATVGIHRLTNYMNGAGAWPGYMVNQYYVEGGKNYENDTAAMAAEVRGLLRDPKFRKALSAGFDRQRLIDVAWNGIGEAKAATISPQSWHFAGAAGQEVYQKWAAADAAFDAAAANAALDELGMKKGADGFRTLPSGAPFVLTIDVTDWGGSLKVQTDAAAEMEVEWETNLGIQVEVKNLQGQPDVDTRTNEGYYMLRGAHISEIDIWTYPDWIFPIVNRYMFPLEGRWFAKGGAACTAPADKPYDCGVQPAEGSPAAILQGLYKQGQDTKTVEERHKVVWAAIEEIIKDGPFVIGVSGDQPMPIFMKDYMRNILDYGVVGPWAPATPGNQIPSTWWMDK